MGISSQASWLLRTVRDVSVAESFDESINEAYRYQACQFQQSYRLQSIFKEKFRELYLVDVNTPVHISCHVSTITIRSAIEIAVLIVE